MVEQIQDTPPHIQKLIIEGYRRMSPQEKFKRVNELTKAIQQLALARIIKRYGQISEREQEIRLASLWWEEEIRIGVCKWNPYEKE